MVYEQRPSQPQAAGCLLAGIIIGMLLLILLSSCGAVNVPRKERLNIRGDSDPMAKFRGDSPPPELRGDPFILSLKNASHSLTPY